MGDAELCIWAPQNIGERFRVSAPNPWVEAERDERREANALSPLVAFATLTRLTSSRLMVTCSAAIIIFAGREVGCEADMISGTPSFGNVQLRSGAAVGPHPSSIASLGSQDWAAPCSKMLAESEMLGEGGDSARAFARIAPCVLELKRVRKSSCIQLLQCQGTTRCGRPRGRTAWRTWSHPGFLVRKGAMVGGESA